MMSWRRSFPPEFFNTFEFGIFEYVVSRHGNGAKPFFSPQLETELAKVYTINKDKI